MTGTKYEDSKGRTVTVKNVENNIAILNNGERVAVERLNDSRFYNQLNSSPSVVEQTVVNESVSSNSTPNRYEALVQNFQKNGQSANLGIVEDSNVHFNPQQGMQGSNPMTTINVSGNVVESHSNNLASINAQPEPTGPVPVVQPYTPQKPEKTIDKNEPISQNPDDIYGDVAHYNKNQNPEEALLEKYKETTAKPKTSTALSRLAYGEDYDKAMLEDKKQEATDNQRPERTERDNVAPRSERENVAPRRREHIIESENVAEVGNPVHQMYDKAKKTKAINVNLKINEKIPNKNVIKMLEENFDDSAVDYYTRQIFLKLMENPKIIEDQVREAINKYVNGNTKK